MALGCGLTSVEGNRGENYENATKHIKKEKKIIVPQSLVNQTLRVDKSTISLTCPKL
jgi:hypothetical protein